MYLYVYICISIMHRCWLQYMRINTTDGTIKSRPNSSLSSQSHLWCDGFFTCWLLRSTKTAPQFFPLCDHEILGTMRSRTIRYWFLTSAMASMSCQQPLFVPERMAAWKTADPRGGYPIIPWENSRHFDWAMVNSHVSHYQRLILHVHSTRSISFYSHGMPSKLQHAADSVPCSSSAPLDISSHQGRVKCQADTQKTVIFTGENHDNQSTCGVPQPYFQRHPHLWCTFLLTST